MFNETMNQDGAVKTLHILRHYKFNVITTYLSTPHSIKFAFLEYEVFSKSALICLAIQNFTFYEFINQGILIILKVQLYQGM